MLLLTFVTLLGTAAVTLVSCERYQLLENGYVDVTMEKRTCLNKQSLSVPVKLVGVASESKAPRKSFTSNTQFFAMDGVKDKLKGDERGHLVASTIGGPSDDSWNMVPQQASVNRKLSKESNIMARWDEFEKWMLLEIGRKNTVQFTIKVNYDNARGCRPVSFEVDATSSAKPSTGFRGTFDNRPDDPFSTVAETQAAMKGKKP
ncbi:uncharacterized protein LOC111040419 [Myzus persicae]|uniref:uncharacterized protein LOC111040419 n=1 Tax=Myzus persicae TaxID=13164 RepID=UPI000B93A050|nr:uncharacterized protein LOC111040419 [Myzus persicae]